MNLFHTYHPTELELFAQGAAYAVHEAGSWQMNPANGRVELFGLEPRPNTADIAGCLLIGKEPEYHTRVNGMHSDYPAIYTRIEGDKLIIDIPHDAPGNDEPVYLNMPETAARMDDIPIEYETYSISYNGEEGRHAFHSCERKYWKTGVHAAIEVIADAIRGHYRKRRIPETELPTVGELAWYVHENMNGKGAFYLPCGNYSVPRFEESGANVKAKERGIVIETTENSITLSIKTPDDYTAQRVWAFSWQA